MAPDAPHRRPGRPVADAPIERLLAHPEEVARNWMFALLSQVELHEAPRLVTEPFTRDGPRVCDAALRALAEESDLRRLERDGALWPLVSRVGEMTGSPTAAHILTAVDALHDVLWTELRRELRGAADPDLVADLAARLTRVCALIRDAGLARAGGGPGLESVRPVGGPAMRGGERRGGGLMPPEAPAGPAAGSSAREPVVGGSQVSETRESAPQAGDAPVGPPEPGAEPSTAGGGGLIGGEPASAPASSREPVSSSEPASCSEPSSSSSSSEPAPAADEPGAAAAAPDRGPPLWVEALEDEIQAAKASFAPLSLLLAEMEDAERIAASAGPERAGEAFGEFALAVRRALRRQDILVQETASRAWVIARDTARAGAHSLGARIAESVGDTSSQGGSPLVASVGVAVLGEDGIDCAQLMEAAEEARFAASARGIEVSRRMR
jgi:GGDEF domain-containing protein